MRGKLPGFVTGSPYYPVLTNPVLRWILPGCLLSYVGDGLGLVAIVLLARDLAASPTLVGIAVASSSLPGALGAVLFSRWLADRSEAQVAGWDATLRAVAFSAIAVFATVGLLTPWGYVALLAASSLLHSWGSASRYTFLAESLDERHHMAANSLMSMFQEVGTIIGPPLAGVLVAVADSALVLAVDALTFAVLAVACRSALRVARRADAPNPPVPRAPCPQRSPYALVVSSRVLMKLFSLTLAFFLLFGPVYVALPLYVLGQGDSSSWLSAYYTAFGLGAFLGALATGFLVRRPRPSTPALVVVGFGVAMLPIGLGVGVGLSLLAFALAGAVWAPYSATSIAILRSITPDHSIGTVLAVNSAIVVLAVPIGTALGGPVIEIIGARQTMLLSSISTIVLGVVALAGRPTAASSRAR